MVVLLLVRVRVVVRDWTFGRNRSFAKDRVAGFV
jgi:hypothetical protein